MPREIEFPDPLQIPVFDNHTHLDISREGEPIDVAAALREAFPGRCDARHADRL